MKALLIVAHGSRRAASNREVIDLAESLQRHQHNDFDLVEAAFLELAEPSIPDGISHCVKQGANDVTVFPYFLNSGRHVTEDIPAEVTKGQSEHPSVKITLSRHLGSAEIMPELVLNTAGIPS